MADKVDKPKKSKAKLKQDEPGVLAALPSTRAERIGTRRASAPKTFEEPAAAQAAATPEPATPTAQKPVAKKPAAKKPAAKKSTAKKSRAKPVSAAESSRAARSSPAAKTSPAAKPRPRAAAPAPEPVAPRTFEPTRAAADAAGSAPPPTPKSEARPRAVSEGAPGIGTSSNRNEPASASGRTSGVEIVTTAAQVVGEVAQIGLKAGGRLVKRAVDRLPKP